MNADHTPSEVGFSPRATGMRHVLLLGGTAEARSLAAVLAHAPDIQAILSRPDGAAGAADALTTRTGGFGGDAGFARWLDAHTPDAVVDGTHPFAETISSRTARLCADRGIPYLMLRRPGWQAAPGDNWQFIEREEGAAAHIPTGATVFLVTGRRTLGRYKNLAGRRLICRVLDQPRAPFPFAGGEFLHGTPPFSVAHESALFQRIGVDWLVVKNAGGTRSRSKLDAARALGIPVLLLRRPPVPDGATVAKTPEAALDWLRALP